MRFGGSKPYRYTVDLPQEDVASNHHLVGESALFRQVIEVVDTVAANDCVVLLEGESGTGKELLARRIHHRSRRADGPFIPVSCPAITKSLFESQFYGHVRGAFTGATSDTLGVVRAAEGGTLLLDEVGELPLALQPKLLRLLQEREVIPVGMSKPLPVDVRFVASTNRSLVRHAAEGTFRRDLYHRLNVVCIQVPPLRVRPGDIEPLIDYYLDLYAEQYGMVRRQLSEYLRDQLRQYPWPGNVRELCGYVERLYAANLPPSAPSLGALEWEDGYGASNAGLDPAPGRMPLPDNAATGLSLAQVESQAILQALEMTGHNRSAAAKVLQIHRSTLLRKIRLHGLDRRS